MQQKEIRQKEEILVGKYRLVVGVGQLVKTLLDSPCMMVILKLLNTFV